MDFDVVAYNRNAWDHQVSIDNPWTRPVNDEVIANAKKGKWEVVLTPLKPVPHHWFGTLKGKYLLGLASGGGQQCPVFAAAGANVTVFDNSGAQLKRDAELSDKHDLKIKTVQGIMTDLSAFHDESFDIIFNPCSVGFSPEVKQVWKECYRILKKGGILMTGFHNPVALQFDEEEAKKKKLFFRHKQPYSDLISITPTELEKFKSASEPLVFGHTLTDLIGGQSEAGLVLTDMFEDYYGNDHPLDLYMPAFLATRAQKL